MRNMVRFLTDAKSARTAKPSVQKQHALEGPSVVSMHVVEACPAAGGRAAGASVGPRSVVLRFLLSLRSCQHLPQVLF